MLKIFCSYLIFIFLTLGVIDTYADGGEIGNGFNAYRNFIGDYSLSYPSSWSYYDIDKSVSFVSESTTSLSKDAFLSVIDKQISGVSNLQKLQEHIRFFHPTVEWKVVNISGHKGYQSLDNNEGVIYLLRSTENILSIRYGTAKKETALAEINEMIQSLIIN